MYIETVKKTMNLPETIRILDTTLRDGEQTPGVAITVDEKIRIAKKLDKLGVDTMEVGFPAGQFTGAEAQRVWFSKTAAG